VGSEGSKLGRDVEVVGREKEHDNNKFNFMVLRVNFMVWKSSLFAVLVLRI